MRKIVCFVFVAALPFLSACDRLADTLDIPNPAKETANAQAIGGACRQTGRSIEDCYALNPEEQKAAIFSGWKSMNEYMIEHKLKEVPSVVANGQVVLQPPHAPIVVAPAPATQGTAH